jgi:hypothetical protein
MKPASRFQWAIKSAKKYLADPFFYLLTEEPESTFAVDVDLNSISATADAGQHPFTSCVSHFSSMILRSAHL